jgi:dolichyl-phosphate beta-glucosyltransferase
VVIPAYNEVERLPPYLAQIRAYLGNTFGSRYEVVVVDDGGTDDLAGSVARQLPPAGQLSVLRQPTNLGKGAALRRGMAAARGDCVLFADADGATPIREERKLRQALAAGADVAVGSRLMPDPGSPVTRMWHRKLSGDLFARVTGRLFALPVRDTQCGFKMFRRAVAQEVFGMCREAGFLIDLEVLLLARRLGYRVAEVGVTWRDVPDSKVRLVRDGVRMVSGLYRLHCSQAGCRRPPVHGLPAPHRLLGQGEFPPLP